MFNYNNNNQVNKHKKKIYCNNVFVSMVATKSGKNDISQEKMGF